MLYAANQLSLRVDRIRPEARDVLSLELVSAYGEGLPSWTPGSHMDLVLPNGLVRQYSLCNLDQRADRYRIAVARSASSEGGSEFIHDTVRRGAELHGRGPRNNFPLVADAGRYLFIAGGIGITPILSMILWCSASRKPWRLLYCCQTRQRAAFVDDILAIPGGAVTLHFDNEHGRAGPDLRTVLATLDTSEHVYCCGPAGLMNAVSSKVPESHRNQLHFEWFKAAPTHVLPSTTEFEVVLQRSGVTLTVPPSSSILEVLEDNGIGAVFGCRSGFCGCCETRVLAGEPDHRDSVLSEQARAQNNVIMICVSRARHGKLVLDA